MYKKIISGVCLVLSVSSVSQAAPVQIDFSGTISSVVVGTPSLLPVKAGTSFSGQFRFDTDSLFASNITSEVPNYWGYSGKTSSYTFSGPAYGMDVTIGGQTVSYDALVIRVADDAGVEPFDFIRVEAKDPFTDPSGVGSMFELQFDFRAG